MKYSTGYVFFAMIILVAISTGCATSYKHPTKGEEAFNRDYEYCNEKAKKIADRKDREASSAAASGLNKHYSPFAWHSFRKSALNECMRAQGWDTTMGLTSDW